jgi:cobalamin-dependent methionine synthase I
MRVQKNRKKIIHTTKKISYAYTINISLRNYEVMNLGVETETKKILKWKKKKKRNK